jgi:2-polyprenyl-3-methyl-5-hydroxy-6-metoxy-1,4-benzoquinol methylase
MSPSQLKEFSNISIKAVQDYWNARPCNIRHSSRSIGSRDYFDEVEKRKYFVEPHIPKFAQFEKWKGKKVLEIGCGIGTDTINFARAGANVTAVDCSEESLRIARQRADVYGLDVDFYKANAEELSKTVPLEEFDLVYSFGVIHHTPNPGRVISEIRKYMSPESTFKIMVYNRRSWKVLWILMTYGKMAFWKIDELIAKYSEARTGCPVTYSYTPKTIEGLLGKFVIEEVQIDHIFSYKIPEYKNYEYVKKWYFRLLGRKIFKWLEKNFGWHLCVTAKLEK